MKLQEKLLGMGANTTGVVEFNFHGFHRLQAQNAFHIVLSETYVLSRTTAASTMFLMALSFGKQWMQLVLNPHKTNTSFSVA